ncbi:MAG TPA: peptidoglycan editing factor PgeF [Nitrospirota bacterium]|nr:peptidoglycan editing factor PgeF [Nitrospirota bacterium]
MRTDTKKDIHYMNIPALERMGAIRHAFTTRANGLGRRNKGARMPDEWNVVAAAFGINTCRVVTVNQVHGENIVKVDELNYRNVRTVHADAMITDVPGLAIGVETADCVPVLLFDPAKSAVAAVHAGWRSTVKKIVQKAINRMSEEFGSEPSRMIAAIGPAIGPECYEVDEPVIGSVREAFSFWKEVTAPRAGDRWSLDLVKANRMELMQIGLLDKNIHSLGMCTSCRKDVFYSYRAEGSTGRMLSVIMIKP